ncbi:putative polyribose polymerase [Phaeomoniella chlamydospora]|uniref:Poly [ADP-ribose] polymerase n=1 Tax=Phaeomoniella chlamydospora TaxID=158046 RepID=A0A0G2GGC3_PHACM|nr:putative polyribose polymerase [Phaeomoniella chlamydospora]
MGRRGRKKASPPPSARSESPKKRSRGESADVVAASPPPAKRLKDGQCINSRSLKLTADENYGGPSSSIYVDEVGTVYDATLNQTNASANNNKFYVIQLLVHDSTQTYRAYTRWGRVGEIGQAKVLGDGSLESAKHEFEKKFRDKSGLRWDQRQDPPKPKKYTFLQKMYEEESNTEDDIDGIPGASKRRESATSLNRSEPTESKLPSPVQRLMNLIFNKDYFASAMSAMNYDTNKLPLGKLSKKTLKDGYTVLKELAELVRDPTIATSRNMSYHQLVEQLSNRYLSLIPHVIPRGSRPPIINTDEAVKREVETLENLTDMRLADQIIKDAGSGTDEEGLSQLDRQFRSLNLREMTPLASESREFTQIEEYLRKTAAQAHLINYDVEDIFRIERSAEQDRFEKSVFADFASQGRSDRRLLWHGSPCTNFGGILSQGLRIAPPEAPVSGYMFSRGVYLASMSTKSANYCRSFQTGNIGLLLLCEAELGNPMLKLYDADYEADEKAKAYGFVSTWGVGRTTPKAWKDASVVNEQLKGVQMPDTSELPGEIEDDRCALAYDEYICYDISQIRLRYLLRVRIS